MSDKLTAVYNALNSGQPDSVRQQRGMRLWRELQQAWSNHMDKTP